MKELGEYLKETRMSNGVSIEEASEDIDISSGQLENIESGNIRAFKDVYALKDQVRDYAKYLGLDPNKITDEFNEFLFEHTSKISLDDIREAQKEMDDKNNKLKSPYTIERKNKINITPILFAVVLCLLIALLVFVILNSINKSPVRDKELLGVQEENYEYTY